jgi:DNA gyrase subunit A
VRFEEGEVRPMGRQATGVRGMRLAEGARLVCMLAAKGEEEADPAKSVLTATANGFGKRTPIGEYPRHGRGGQGVIAIQTSERNGAVVGAVLVEDQDEVMLISTGGVLIRTAVAQIREQGRSTQGVTLIALGEGEKLAGMERIDERDLGNGNGNGGHAGNGNGGNGDAHEEPPAPEEPGPTVH